MHNMLLLYISLIITGFLALYTVISSHRRLVRNREFILGVRPKEEAERNIKQGKNKQQVELELLLVNNNKITEFLGIIDRNIKIKILIIMFLCGIYYLFNRQQENMASVFALIFITTIVIPGILTSVILKRKFKSIMTDLPSFIDLTAVCVQSGMTIDMSLKRIATDFKILNPDLSYVMLRVVRKSEITSLSSALDDLSSSLPTREIKMFATVLQQSLNFGTSIYTQLIQLSADIRELQLLTIEEKLGTLSAKMSIPLILFIMFPIIILILAPGAMRVLANVF